MNRRQFLATPLVPFMRPAAGFEQAGFDDHKKYNDHPRDRGCFATSPRGRTPAGKNAAAGWFTRAKHVGRRAANRDPTFGADGVWRSAHATPGEPALLGPPRLDEFWKLCRGWGWGGLGGVGWGGGGGGLGAGGVGGGGVLWWGGGGGGGRLMPLGAPTTRSYDLLARRSHADLANPRGAMVPSGFRSTPACPTSTTIARARGRRAFPRLLHE